MKYKIHLLPYRPMLRSFSIVSTRRAIYQEWF